MSDTFVLKNGLVYDPANDLEGEVRDVYVANGKIVESLPLKKLEIVDVKGMVVAPGNVEIHSHIAGPKLTIGRLLRPEDHIKDPVKGNYPLRAGVGFSVPTTFITAYRYLLLGYTTVMEAAVPPLEARHAIDEFKDMPVVDKGMYILMGNNNIIFDLVKRGEIKEAKLFAAWMLDAAGGYGIKIVNPGGTDSWKWGKIFNSLRDETPWGISPVDVVRLLAEVAVDYGLPHPIHMHTYNLGIPGNAKAMLDTISALGDYPAHLTHVQFYCYGGDSWGSFRSEAAKVAEELQKHPNITIDMGQVLFEDTTTMTADTPWQYRLHRLTKNRWVSTDVEMESGAGLVPYRYRKENVVNAIQWASGLELAMLLDPWHVFLTTDHPNGGPFFMYPKVVEWLTSEEARKRTLSELPKVVRERTILESMHRELSISDIFIMMSAGPARALGLENKGHLGVGADADIAVYKRHGTVAETISDLCMLFKSGRLVVKDGKVIEGEKNGKLLRVSPGVRDDMLGARVKELFDQFYSVKFENYRVETAYLKDEEVISCGSQR